jgi:hypothetical protein
MLQPTVTNTKAMSYQNNLSVTSMVKDDAKIGVLESNAGMTY